MTNHEPKHPPADVPVAWMVTFNNGRKIVLTKPDPADWLSVTPLYAHPPADMAGLDGLIERLDRWPGFGYGVEASFTMTEAATQLQALAARVKVLEAENERLREALDNLINAYVTNVDTYRLGGFYTDPETEDEVIEARAALKGTEQ